MKYIFVFFIFLPFDSNSVLNIDLNAMEKPELIDVVQTLDKKVEDLEQVIIFVKGCNIDLSSEYKDLKKKNFELRQNLETQKIENKDLKLELKQLQDTNHNLSVTVSTQSGQLKNAKGSGVMSKTFYGLGIFICVYLIYHFIIYDWIFPDKEWDEMCEEIQKGYDEAEQWVKENQHLIEGK